MTTIAPLSAYWTARAACDGSAVAVVRHHAPSGNRARDAFSAQCPCGYTGAWHSNRTTEGRTLSERDAEDHRRAGRARHV